MAWWDAIQSEAMTCQSMQELIPQSNASSMTTSAAVRLSPLSCLKSHSPAGFSSTMRSPAKVEDRVSIVDKCTPVSALRNLEVGLVQTVVPLPCPHQLVPIAPHGFVPRRAPLPTVGLPSQSLAQNRQYRDTVTCLPTPAGQELSRLRRSE